MKDVTVQCSAAYSKITSLTHHMPIRYNMLHAPMLPADVSEDAANL